jgi:two-component system LytT family sensor kinase
LKVFMLKMKIVKYRYFNFILHALAWSIVLFLPYLISSAGNQYKIGPLPGLYFTLSGVIHMIIFYGNALFLYPKFLNRAYWWLYIVSAILLIIFSVRMKFYVLTWWFPNDLPDARTHILFPSVLAFIVSVFYSIGVDKIRAEKLQKENEAMQLGMELKFLRSQISPHFLFNILTNLVSLARKKSDQLETSLLMLSGLMRYMLYDAGKKVSLQQEAEYLESYITLQKLRFGRDVKIVCNIELPHEEANYSIEPMLLIPFVENAFKHGTGYMDQPVIDINLTVRDGILVFQVKNRFDQETDTSKDESSGIGLSNVRSRLTLLYPGRHDLVIHTDKSLFTINLTLKLL